MKTIVGNALPERVYTFKQGDGSALVLQDIQSIVLFFRLKGSATPATQITATVVGDGTAGQVRTANEGSVLTQPGNYLGRFRITYTDTRVMNLPESEEDGIDFEVSPAIASFETIESFRDPLRILLGDFDPDVKMYPDKALDEGVRTALSMGLAPGYVLTPSRNSVSPAVATPEDFALITLETARLFVSGRPDRQSVRTRVASESVGSYKELLRTIEDRLSEIRGGKAPVQTWQSLYSFMVGTQGLPDIALFSTVTVEQSLKEFSIYARSSNI